MAKSIMSKSVYLMALASKYNSQRQKIKQNMKVNLLTVRNKVMGNNLEKIHYIKDNGSMMKKVGKELNLLSKRKRKFRSHKVIV